ncbi:DUF7691 family protein [Nocardia yamanashiensis]|uniref:DUF7691 family protein n=1 Tax=Nocardia yamanashiensis TaxID=209247 RepID=UPI000A91369B|nr:hypothetical protein [Nocardia yamanashiensis]
MSYAVMPYAVDVNRIRAAVDAGTSFPDGYAFKDFCAAEGAMLANEGWWGMRSAYFDVVDAALSELGAGFKVSHLVFSGAPVSVPVEDFPVIGYVGNDRVGEYADALAALDLGGVDAGVRESITQLREWFEDCRARGTGWVSFYH